MGRHSNQLPDVLRCAEASCTARDLGADLEISAAHAGIVLRYWEVRGMLTAELEPVTATAGSGSRQKCKRYRLSPAGMTALVEYRGIRPEQQDAALTLAAALGYAIR